MKYFAKHWVLPIFLNIVAAYIWGCVEYGKGYDAGLVAGRKDALSAFSEETVDIVLKRNLKIDQALLQREKSLTARLKKQEDKFKAWLHKEEDDFRQGQAEEEAEFRRGLDELISTRYGKILLETQTASYEDGETTGYAKGRKFGQSECRSVCDRNLEDFKSYGRLWLRFVEAVRHYQEVNPRTATEMRSYAEAIVEIAGQGRAAAAGMADQLNSQVDAIGQALEAGNLERGKELIRSLESTLGAKGEAWQRHYQTIVMFAQG